MLRHITIILLLAALLAPAMIHAAPVQIPQTGQTGCWDGSGNLISCAGTGQDGDKRAGAIPPTPRFTDNANGTVTDNLTGLIWLKDATCFAFAHWPAALAAANSLASGACGLTDGSVAGDWRLPNINELESLVDLLQAHDGRPALPDGHPFTVPAYPWGIPYWSSTTFNLAWGPDTAWYVDLADENLSNAGKDTFNDYGIWPVRGGQ